jgi:hypothetical protein
MQAVNAVPPVEQRERWDQVMVRQRAKRDAKNANKPKKYTAADAENGIPFDGRAKRKARTDDQARKVGAPSYDKNPSWHSGKLDDGTTVYGNNAFLVKGEVPNGGYSRSVPAQSLFNATTKELLTPVAYEKNDNSVAEVVWFNDGTGVNAILYDYIIEKHPGAQLATTDGAHLIALKGGEKVGLVMPLRNRAKAINAEAIVNGEGMPDAENEDEDVFGMNPFLNPVDIVKAIKGFKENLEEDLPKLVELGKRAYEEGATTTKDFIGKMKEWLGDKYAQFKDYMLKTFQAVKQWNEDLGAKGQARSVAGVTKDIKEMAVNTVEDAGKVLTSFVHGTGELGAWFKEGVAPTVGNQRAREFAQGVNKVYGNLGRQIDIVRTAAEVYHKEFQKMGHAEKMNFMAGMHMGTGVRADLEPVAAFTDLVNRNLMEQLRAVAPDLVPELREHYFTAIFKPRSGKDQIIAALLSKTPWEGTRGWQHKRWNDDVREAEQKGLHLVSDNPMDILALHTADVQRTIGARTVMKELQQSGDVVLKSARHRMPDGFTTINDRSAEVWRNSIPAWKVQELIAKKPLKGLAIEEFGKELFDNPDMKQELNDLRWEITKDNMVVAELNAFAMHQSTGKSYTNLVMDKLTEMNQQEFADQAPNIYARLSELADGIDGIDEAAAMPQFDNKGQRLYVDGRIKVGDYVIRADIAPVLNNYLAKSLYSERYGAPIRWIRSAGNVLNAFQLVGFFHANFVARDMVHNEISMAIADTWRAVIGKGSFKTAAKRIVSVPTAPIRTFLKGRTLVKEWNTPGSQGQEAAVLVQELANSWAKPHMDEEFRTDNWDKAKAAVADKRPLAAVGRGILAAPEKAQSWLMDSMVPYAKTGAKAMLIERAMELNPNWTAEQRLAFSNEVGNIIDASMGQVNYNRLYMKRYWLQIIQNLLRAPGWTGGTNYLALKALPEAYEFVKE